MSKPSRPRVIFNNAHKYIGRQVTIIGEVISITPHAKSLTIRLPDEETIIVLLDKNSSTIEPNLLTEVTGTLVSRGSVESNYVRQWNAKQSAIFNKQAYVEAVNFYEAFRHHYDV